MRATGKTQTAETILHKLESICTYDSTNGGFVRTKYFWGKPAGESYGYITNHSTPYRAARIEGKLYYIHVLVWLWHTGNFPTQEIDHINHDGLDNRIENLRVVSRKINARNQKKRSTNTSGNTGVYWYPSLAKWQAAICVNGIATHLGYFAAKQDAIKARADAEDKHEFFYLHGE